MLAMSWYLTDITEERLHYQVGQRALIQAMQISAMPELVEAVQKRDLARIKALTPMRSAGHLSVMPAASACITSILMKSANRWKAAIAMRR